MERTYLGDLERGERNLTVFNLWRIAGALGISPSRLVLAIDKRYRRLQGEAVSAPETPVERQMRRLRRLMDEAPGMKWLEDSRRRTVYSNQQLLDFLGCKMEDLEGERWKQTVHPEDLAKLERESLRGTRSRQPFISQYRLRRADGAWVWVIQQAAPQFTPKGEFVGFLGCVTETAKPKAPLRDR